MCGEDYFIRCPGCGDLYSPKTKLANCELCGAHLPKSRYVCETSGKGAPSKVLGAENGVDPERAKVRWRDDVVGWEVTDKKHPLELAFKLAVEQATKGKGERHGGDSVPFYDQQWTTLADCHGVGFLTGQAAKKLNEAAQKNDDEAWEREVLGALVYAGMAILKKRGYPD